MTVKGDAQIIKHLNEVLTNELTAIDQYFVHAKMFGHWGFHRPPRASARPRSTR